MGLGGYGTVASAAAIRDVGAAYFGLCSRSADGHDECRP